MSEPTSVPVAVPGVVDRALGLLSTLPLVLILGLTFADVFARYVFAAPIRGSVEIIEYAMAMVIFAALPLVTRQRGHVSVSLTDGLVRGGLRRVKNVLCDGTSTLALALLSWRLWVLAGEASTAGAATVVLGWPHAPLFYAMAVFSGMATLGMAWLAQRSLRGVEATP